MTTVVLAYRGISREIIVIFYFLIISLCYCQNNHTPIFPPQPSSFNISELTPVGAGIFTCQASNDDTPSPATLSFSIVGGDVGGHFQVNSSTCSVTLLSSLDYETELRYDLSIEVTDLDPVAPQSAVAVFTVLVDDVNEKPILEGLTWTPTIEENGPAGVAVFECSATDPDDSSTPRGQLSYVIVGGNSNNAFSLTSPCRVTTSRPLDYETTEAYDLEIRVTDLDPVQPQNDTHIYHIMVKDINDNSPYFTHVPASPTALPEDTPLDVSLTNCTGDDEDAGEATGQVRFHVVAGNEESYFSLDPLTCAFSLLKALDYDTGPSFFNLTVQASDMDPVRPRTTQQPFLFCVTSVNDNSPAWRSPPPQQVEIKENAPLGTHLGSCRATDDDAPHHPSSHVRYKIVAGNAGPLFYLNPYTCDLYVNGLLDYELKKAYALKIVAVDLDPDHPRESEPAAVKISVVDENDNRPVCTADTLTCELPEDTPTRSVVATLVCSDLDSRANGRLRFSVLSGDTQALKVEMTSGQVILLERQDWDDVRRPGHLELLVLVQDMGDPALNTTLTLRLLVTDRDDNTPVFSQDVYHVYVPETSGRGTTVLTLRAQDADQAATYASHVTFAPLTNATPDWLLVNPRTGDVVVKQALDAELSTAVEMKVLAFSSNSSGRYGKARVVLHVQNVYDTPPHFTQSVYHVSVSERLLPAKPILTVRATASDTAGPALGQYAIQDGPLSVDNVTGEVRVTLALDFEQQQTHILVLTARDAQSPTTFSHAAIVLTVLPRNEYSPQLATTATFSVAEHTPPETLVFKLEALDRDEGWDGEVDFLSLLTPTIPFLVLPSGHVRLAAPLDRETTPIYHLAVVLVDKARMTSSRSVTATVTITVDDVNDLPPECPTVPLLAVLKYPWIGLTVAQVECKEDADLVNGQLSYSISSGNDDNIFNVNETTGEISAKAHPTLSEYRLTLNVSDGGYPKMTSPVDVIILVEPLLSFVHAPESVSVREDVSVGSTVFQFDACCSYYSTRFQLLSGNKNSQFDLHSVSGALTLQQPLDREMGPQYGLMVEVVEVGGQQSAIATLTVHVLDVNDNPPSFHPDFNLLKVRDTLAVNSTLGQWTATDNDAGSNAAVTYSLQDDHGGRFMLDATSGILLLTAPLDSRREVFMLTLLATDGGDTPLSGTATLQIVIVREDFSQWINFLGPGEVSVPEDFPLGGVVFVINASVIVDDGDVSMFYLVGAAEPFLVMPDSGEVVLAARLDRELVDVYDLYLQAVRGQGDTKDFTVRVHVQDVDDNDPVFANLVYEFYVSDGTPAGLTVGIVSVSDEDLAENADVIVTIVSGNEAGYFYMNGMALVAARELQYDAKKELALTLRATVGDRSFRYAEATVRVVVEAGRAPPPSFEVREVVASVAESTPPYTQVADLAATSLGAREGSNGTLRYELRSDGWESLFAVDEYSGVLITAGRLDRDSCQRHVLEVVAVSRLDPGLTDSAVVTVLVLDVNDNAPVPLAAVVRLTVAEDEAVGTSVGRVVFGDLDEGDAGRMTLAAFGCDRFRVEPNTGEVFVSQVLDYRQRAVYSCIITATDQGEPALSGMTSLLVTVIDVNNNAPEFFAFNGNLRVREDAGIGTTVATVMASDYDADDNAVVTYSLISCTPHNAFVLNTTTGHIVLTSILDAARTPRFELLIAAADHGVPSLSSSTNLTIDIIDLNDHAPLIILTAQEVGVDRLASRGTVLTSFSWEDKDLGDNALVSVFITGGNIGGWFWADSVDAQLVTLTSLETCPDRVELTLTTTDRGVPRLSSSINLTLHISPPLVPQPPSSLPHYRFSVSEDTEVGGLVGTVLADSLLPIKESRIVSGNFDDSFAVLPAVNGGTAVTVAAPLDFEKYPHFVLLVRLKTEDNNSVDLLVEVRVTDVNDNAPVVREGGQLLLTVAEHTPVGQVLWTLSAHDADSEAVNGVLHFGLLRSSVDGLLHVTDSGAILLLDSPEYSLYHQVDAVITVRDGGTPPLSSSVIVTLDVLDVQERRYVDTPLVSSLFFSAEVPFNSQQMQLVHTFKVEDFGLNQSTTSLVSFVSTDTSGPFKVNGTSGEVALTSPGDAADGFAYFVWLVCSLRHSDGSDHSEVGLLRIDTFDMYRHLVALDVALDLEDSEDERALVSKVQGLFNVTQRVSIYTVRHRAPTDTRRLLAVRSTVLLYVVGDTSTDQLDNVASTKSFLTQDAILQILQLSPDGTPVPALTSDPLPVELVKPYVKDSFEDKSVMQTAYFPAIMSLAALVVIAVVVVMVCLIRKCLQRSRQIAKTPGHRKLITTPQPAFFVRREKQGCDIVSYGSTGSLHTGNNDTVKLQISANLQTPATHDVNQSKKRGQSKPTVPELPRGASSAKWTCPTPMPLLSWLPDLPHDLQESRPQSSLRKNKIDQEGFIHPSSFRPHRQLDSPASSKTSHRPPLSARNVSDRQNLVSSYNDRRTLNIKPRRSSEPQSRITAERRGSGITKVQKSSVWTYRNSYSIDRRQENLHDSGLRSSSSSLAPQSPDSSFEDGLRTDRQDLLQNALFAEGRPSDLPNGHDCSKRANSISPSIDQGRQCPPPTGSRPMLGTTSRRRRTLASESPSSFLHDGHSLEFPVRDTLRC